MNKLLNIADAAKTTGLSVSWWRKAITAQKMPFVQVGRRVMIREETIDKFIEENTVPAKEE